MYDVLSRFPSLQAGSHLLQSWSLALVLVAMSVVGSYFWLDRPIAMLAHQFGFGNPQALEFINRIPDPITLLADIVLFVVGWSAYARGHLPKRQQVMVVCAISVLVGEQTKDILKWIFGRPSPKIWIANNGSSGGNHDYHFHWFGGGGAFNSFPSGHMTAITAVVAVIWICYPQLRSLCATAVVFMAAALIGMNFHFLGDVIAGGLLGSTIGLIMLKLFDLNLVQPSGSRVSRP
jgi:membrane-associated phospholipid phosphatase